MQAEQWTLLAINVIGGSAVIGSYIQGFRSHKGRTEAAWGGVPARIKPLYTVSMLLAALGYLAFTHFILFRIKPNEIEIARTLGYEAFFGIYAAILIFSALWMPFTFSMIERPRRGTWVIIRAALGIVGMGALVLLAFLCLLEPRSPAVSYWGAIAGCWFFSLQTALLDAIVWPAYFDRKG